MLARLLLAVLLLSSATTAIQLPKEYLRDNVFNIRDFGAKPDCKTLNTNAFQRAVAAVASAGSGILEVPSGCWLTGPFNLTSHMTLFLSDATILASDNFDDWPVVPPLPSYGRGRELPGKRYAGFISAHHAQDLIIVGSNGTIDGQGQRWWDAHHAGSLNFTRGRLIEPMDSERIILTNLTLKNSPFWTVHPYNSNNISITHLNIQNPPHSPNTDGIDPDSCQFVYISDCTIDVGDDAIAIKSGWDEAGYDFARPSANIVITRLVVSSPTSAGICIGSEMSGGVANVSASQVTMTNTSTGIRIKAARGRGGFVQNIVYDGIQMDEVTTAPPWPLKVVQQVGIAVQINDFYGDHPSPTYNHSAVPIVDNINILNIKATNVHQAVDLEGLDDAKITGVQFYNVDISGPNLKGWKCSDVSGTAAHTSPTPCKDIVPTA